MRQRNYTHGHSLQTLRLKLGLRMQSVMIMAVAAANGSLSVLNLVNPSGKGVSSLMNIDSLQFVFDRNFTAAKLESLEWRKFFEENVYLWTCLNQGLFIFDSR